MGPPPDEGLWKTTHTFLTNCHREIEAMEEAMPFPGPEMVSQELQSECFVGGQHIRIF